MQGQDERLILWPFYLIMIIGVYFILGSFAVKNITEDAAYNEKLLAIDAAFLHDSLMSTTGNINGELIYDEERTLVLNENCEISVGSSLETERKERYNCGLAKDEIIVNKENKLSKTTYFNKDKNEVYIGQDGN